MNNDIKFKELLLKIDPKYKEKLANDNSDNITTKYLDSSSEDILSKIKGRQFYTIVNKLTNNFNSACLIAFENLEPKPQDNKIEVSDDIVTISKAAEFINQFIVTKKDVAKLAGIETTRFSKIITGTVNDFLAFEVYSIAKTQKMDFKKAFEQLYK